MHEFESVYSSPIDFFHITASHKGITSITCHEHPPAIINQPNQHITQCITELDEYFAQKRKDFTIPLDIQGTPFQHTVWQELLKIPFGETRSYKQIAESIGNLLAIRAVGTTNGKNKIMIIIPCHRVIGSNGALTGYAGGLHRKQWLLNFEKGYIGVQNNQLSLY